MAHFVTKLTNPAIPPPTAPPPLDLTSGYGSDIRHRPTIHHVLDPCYVFPSHRWVHVGLPGYLHIPL